MQRGVGRLFICISVFLAVILALTCMPTTSAQETTGGIKVNVKDKSKGAVPKATVELSGSGLITARKLTTDDAGYVYFDQIPPGEYTLTVTATNFRTYKVAGINLAVGKLPTYDVGLEIGEVTQTVEVTSSAFQVDVTASKVAVAIPQDVIENVPKGRSFQSLIPLAPGARQEPLQSSRVDRFRQNGFQIDGASDSENTYLVEGLDTTNIQSGGVKQNVIFEFVQEVQVKTSGFEAEYGGAMGGVVNVIQKRGSNNWHGELLSYYRTSGLDANDQCATTPQPVVSEAVVPSSQQLRCGLRPEPGTGDASKRLDQNAQYYQQKKDGYYVIEPGFDIGGPIFKDKLWLFTSYIPTIDRISRTNVFTGATNPGPRSFTRSTTTQNMFNRLDYQPFSKLRLYAGWQYGYSRISGVLPTFPDSLNGQVNTIAGNDPTTFRQDTGSVNPSNILNFGGDWTVNSRTVIAARYGYFYYNSSDRGKPAGIRYVFQNDFTTGASGTKGINGSPLIPNSTDANAAFAKLTGFANISNNSATIFDVFSRKSFSTDVSHFVSKWGTHNFKVGYGFNRLYNNVVNSYNTSEVDFYPGQTYTTHSAIGTGATNCAAIIAANSPQYGTPAQAATAGCRGNVGYFIVHDGVNTAGVASSYNHGLYFQDGWTLGRYLTLNLGVRLDKEFVPPYKAGASSINFNFSDKVAPRIGGAYDLFHNGKVKIFASYGKFFDIMKYSLARGSFGGEYWHDCVYAQDFFNFNTITPTSPGGHSCGPGTDPSAGVTVGRFVEDYDYRASVINTKDPGVDPNLKPMSQHETVMGADWAVTPRLGLEVRWARKRLDNAIEDQAVTDATGYYIGNPGTSTYTAMLHRVTTDASSGAALTPLPAQCPTCPPEPKAIRRYDGLETRLSYRRTNLFGALSYTYSSLTGNYSGLTDTDVTDGSGGRHNPNNHRDFDLPAMQYTTSGKVMDGPLSTDRPHVLSLTGYYQLKWWGMQTTFGANQLAASGTPKSTCIPMVGTTSSCQYWDQRGTFANMHRDSATGNIVLDSVVQGARMPRYTQTDFNFGHTFRVSKTNEAMKLGFEWNVLNLFNQASALAVSPTPWAIPSNNVVVTPATNANSLGIDWLTLETGWDPIKAANSNAPGNPVVYGINSPRIMSTWYGQPYIFQSRRTMRLALRFTF